MREYKIYLPLKYNDGKGIESEKLREVKRELVDTFGAITVSSLSAPYQGTWKYGGVEFIDDIIKIEIVATNDRATKRFFKDFKERLKESLQPRDSSHLSRLIVIVRLKKKNARYRDLTFGQPYVVIGIEADELRLLNDAGRPFLYRPALFSLVDPIEPVDWVTEFGDDGERYSYPPSLNKSAFFEDFFDQKAKAVSTFWRVVSQRLAAIQRRVA